MPRPVLQWRAGRGFGVSAVRDPGVYDVAAAIRVSIGLLLLRLRQVRPAGELSLPENSTPGSATGQAHDPKCAGQTRADQPAIRRRSGSRY